MKQLWKENRITLCVIALGLACALVLCGIRMGTEARNNHVAVIMTQEDMNTLNRPINGVRIFNGDPVLDNTLLLVEDRYQYSATPISENADISEYTGESGKARYARCLYLMPDWMSLRYIWLDYTQGEELENIFYRAITERNVRVLWLTPFIANGEPVTDAADYERVLSNLSARLEEHGITIGDTFSTISEYTPSTILLCGVYWGVLAAAYLLLRKLIVLLPEKRNRVQKTTAKSVCDEKNSVKEKPLRERLLKLLPEWLSLLWLAPAAVLSYFLPQLSVTLFAFLTALTVPCFAVLYLDSSWPRTGLTLQSRVRVFIKLLFVSVIICTVGGLVVGAIQSGSDYLLTRLNFRGVKLSLFGPVAFALLLSLMHICRPHELLKLPKWTLVLVFVACCGAVGYYLLRSGNASVSDFEQKFRIMLERHLLVRPRTKEMLIAWPCMAAAVALLQCGARKFGWVFTTGCATGLTSVVNTFCHSRACLWVSLVRTGLGLLIGGAIGIVLICLTYMTNRPKNSP